MELQGKIKKIFDLETFASGFTKQSVVITTDDQYPQDILIDFLQDRIDLLHNLTIGESVKISINIRGKEWINPEGVAKYFNSIQGWKIDRQSTTKNSVQPTNFQEYSQPTNDGSDDLPF